MINEGNAASPSVCHRFTVRVEMCVNATAKQSVDGKGIHIMNNASEGVVHHIATSGQVCRSP